MIELLADPRVAAQRALFVITVVLEVLALQQAWRCRTGFARGDPGRTLWSLIATFLAVRVLAELRLMTLYFDLVPEVIARSDVAVQVYVVVLRYLYTASDLLLAIALFAMIRSYRSLGLHFGVQRRDRATIAVVMALPVVAWLLRHRLTAFIDGDDQSIAVYRLVAVTVSAVIAALCIVVFRYVSQMGGGALAKVWRAAVVAGVARAASFVVLAVVSIASAAWASLAEQALLVVFATAWIVAARRQREVLAYGKRASHAPP
jgi:hypothetical protein